MAVRGESRDFAAAALAGLALFDVVMNIIDQLRGAEEGGQGGRGDGGEGEQDFHLCLKLLFLERVISNLIERYFHVMPWAVTIHESRMHFDRKEERGRGRRRGEGSGAARLQSGRAIRLPPTKA